MLGTNSVALESRENSIVLLAEVVRVKVDSMTIIKAVGREGSDAPPATKWGLGFRPFPQEARNNAAEGAFDPRQPAPLAADKRQPILRQCQALAGLDRLERRRGTSLVAGAGQ